MTHRTRSKLRTALASASIRAGAASREAADEVPNVHAILADIACAEAALKQAYRVLALRRIP